MTAPDFYTTVLTRWGESWRPELRKLLAAHGHHYSRQAIYNWQSGKTAVPDFVGVILGSK